MDSPLPFAAIEKDFRESLGYVRDDIEALVNGQTKPNYTVALLVGCGCEMLAAAYNKRKHPEEILAELLPPGDWRVLSKRLYTALRDGLAHGFDTKHLDVDGEVIQIIIAWLDGDLIDLARVSPWGLAVWISVLTLAKDLCAKITAFENDLKGDEVLRRQFKRSCEHQQMTTLDTREKQAWERLVAAL